MEPLTTGCAPLDALLGGGVERGAVTQVYGPPGAGKTNVALSTAAHAAAAGMTVVYVDTEGLSAERFQQVLSAVADDPDRAAERIVVSEAYDFDEQAEAVKDTEGFAERADLIVLDSATGFYRLRRTEEGGEDGEALRDVARQVTHLLSLARRHDLAVLVTNQVYTDPEAERTRPLGGQTLEHWTATVVRLERFRGDARRAVLEKHRAKPTGERARFSITDAGIEAASDGTGV
ncbi:DNA repair and recombination protein RadB [Halarchaeum sp. CBA1220]|uniref:DNA repair and recombination protein RadB n=1 Tax=Halarchaeum sp. CBA1220 TaxID=1853682 RepID=UPI000F3A8FFD|nr:DNA repair and recombination protein RadB [Halarchaeum sp. CBA1220]QLC32944.1 DNA repair and recombination protein RadB [Halarchaeum sp. CBA1220]